MKKEGNKISKKKIAGYLFMILFILYVINFLYHTTKSLPDGISFAGNYHEVNNEDISFYYDLTYETIHGDIVTEHQIYDQIFSIINKSESFILIDLFLIDRRDEYAQGGNKIYRHLSKELVDSLIERNNKGDVQIYFMTDYLNTFYGSLSNKNFGELENSGINVYFSDLKFLRDSNPFYSSFWRIFLSWIDLPNYTCEKSLIGYGGDKVCFRSIFYALNFKANHRKIVVADFTEDKNLRVASVFTSGNPSDYGSRHSNVAVVIEENASRKGLWTDILHSEKTLAEKSDANFLDIKIPEEEYKITEYNLNENKSYVKFLGEKEIKKDFIKEIENSVEGEEINIAQFLLTDQDVSNSLIDASKRGVKIKIILDPSSQLFGKDTKGMPNYHAVDYILDKTKKSTTPVEIKFYNTHAEEYHSKLMIIKKKDGKIIIYVGSANLTRRNLDDLNLEADVKILSRVDSEFALDIQTYFDKLWNNLDGKFTENNNIKSSKLNYLKFRLQEFTGFCAW